MSRNLPAISAQGEPLGETTVKLTPPNGMDASTWQQLIELGAAHFRRTSGVSEPTLEVLKAYDVSDEISKKAWRLLGYGHNWERYRKALAIRGVLPLGVGLTVTQSLAIDIMSDPTQGSFRTRLRKANIKEFQWQQWMLDVNFAEQFNTLVTRRMNANSGLIDVTLTEAAIQGSMDAIKYYDKRIGRDPDKRSEIDGRKVIVIVMDAITKHLSEHPDLLRKIAAEIEVRMKVNGDIHD